MLADGGEDREGGAMMEEGFFPSELPMENNTAQVFILTPSLIAAWERKEHGLMSERRSRPIT